MQRYHPTGRPEEACVWRLSDGTAEHLARGNELGMGYQFAQGRSDADLGHVFVFNGTYAVRAEAMVQDSALMAKAEPELDDLPVLDADLVLSSDFEAFARLAGLAPAMPHVRARFGTLHGSPPFAGITASVMTFVRYSAFARDPRVGANGSLTPGTYVTSIADAHEVPSGLAAVGRYALPNPRPAIHRFDVTVPAGTPYLYGSVIPAFGRSGGGVEIEFPNGVAHPIHLVRTVITEM